MTTLDKQSIQAALRGYVERYESQNQAANSLKGVSAAMVTQILRGNWEKISEQMWRNVAAQIGYTANKWQGVATSVYTKFNQVLSNAQEHSNVFAVVGGAGSGKTFTCKSYVESHERAYHLMCNEYWNKKLMLDELLRLMGRDGGGSTIGEMMSEIVHALKKSNRPLIILDEADKLNDQLLFFFITLYNQLEDSCGIVLCATEHLQKRVKRGLKLNKRGYSEIYSRIGRKFIELKANKRKDIEAVCSANGVEDLDAIAEIYNSSEGDLRMVKIGVHAYINS